MKHQLKMIDKRCCEKKDFLCAVVTGIITVLKSVARIRLVYV
jgi:hypothetical protein